MNRPESLQPYIRRFLEQKHGVSVAPRVTAMVTLGGGYTAKEIYRVDVAYELNGGSRNLAFVFKRTTAQEVLALRALVPLAREYALPQLVGSGEDRSGPWVLYSFIDGQPHNEFTLPSDAVAALARVHTAYLAQPPPPLPRVDANDWLRHLDAAEEALNQAGGVWAWNYLEALRAADGVSAALDQLPATLLHGDVHPANIIVSLADNRGYVVDWGNARLGPAGLDLANCIGHMESPAWRQYWEKAQMLGYFATADEQERQFRLGKVYVSVHYLPWAVSHFNSEHAARMLREAHDAARELS